MIYLYETRDDWRLSRVKAEKTMIELTGLCSVRGYGGGGRQSGDAAKRLSTTVLDIPAVTRRGGRR